MKKQVINANGTEIGVIGNINTEEAYISLTDIAKYKNSEDPRIVISNWMSSYSTIDYLAIWEELYNPDFNRMEFHTVRNEPGRLVMTPTQWIERMNAIGLISKAGRYGGTYAHSDIAFEFASWVSLEFKLYLIKDYQRLKKDEAERLLIGWDAKRELSKINYRIHTDAVREFLITPELTKEEITHQYASEADLLNVALFGKTALQWRKETGVKGMSPNIRDYASPEELIVLINLEDTNADYIRQGLPQTERLKLLREKAYRQLQVLRSDKASMDGLKKVIASDNTKKITKKDL
ncbi:MAG: KilA-N domain-containing protein [Firmicutes bacterium]|nr:KilA-N domain-containing protein [Bacillota bacterium]